MKPIEVLKARIGVPPRMPDPANIEIAGDWYLLDHISGGLLGFSHETNTFDPVYAEMKAHSNGIYTFTLKDGARFHDGSPITARDVIASFKRLLIKKSSTHFPLWEYLKGCDDLKSMEDECPGLTAIGDRTIEMRLRFETPNFVLQVSSPETGIWSASDIDRETLELNPTKFSGPYYLSKLSDQGFELLRNEYSPISKKFKNSPRRIDFVNIPLNGSDQLVLSQELDLNLRPQMPYAEKSWSELGAQVYLSAPSILIYFYGTDKEGKAFLGKNFVQKAWENNTDQVLIPADKFLPFIGDYALSKEEFLGSLPDTSSNKVRLAVPWTYLSDDFLNLLKTSAQEFGIELDLIRLDPQAWRESFENPESSKNFDFVLGIYAASERYPAVQLRYITRNYKKPPIDLKEAEVPELGPKETKILKDYQRWLLSNNHALPLFFMRNQILYQSDIDLGSQPPSDAEIELWRVTRK